MFRRSLTRALLACVALAAVAPTLAAADTPVHVRVIKGSRKGPAKMDPKLDSLKRQLSPLAYVQWEQASEESKTLVKGKTDYVLLPDGDQVALTVMEEAPTKVTFEVVLVSRKTQSKLTLEKGQRLVHQVTGEKDGSAFFLTVIAWPDKT
jgi:hypothetical protein